MLSQSSYALLYTMTSEKNTKKYKIRTNFSLRYSFYDMGTKYSIDREKPGVISPILAHLFKVLSWCDCFLIPGTQELGKSTFSVMDEDYSCYAFWLWPKRRSLL